VQLTASNGRGVHFPCAAWHQNHSPLKVKKPRRTSFAPPEWKENDGMKKMLQAAAILLALTLAPVLTASAHDNKGRKHRHGRKRTTVTTAHVNHRNPSPGVPRRVRRGRNTTPGVRRGAAATTRTTATAPRRTRTGAGAAVALEHKGRGHGKH
jgi:hypothetical protein